TPLVMTLASALAARGWRPGIVSRGYGGSASGVTAVRADDDPQDVGDEPLLLARTGYPVWIGRDRPAAARALLAAEGECNVIIADDGLQHYALGRDVEIAVLDGTRPFGNGWPLPAGPLREPKSRLAGVDASVVLSTTGASPIAGFVMRLEGSRFVHLNAPTHTAGPETFRTGNVHAIAGIGHPERFFAHLASLGIVATCHAFPDHHRYSMSDIAWREASAILMTEKDAVKCARFADGRFWMLPVRAAVDAALID